MIKPNVQNTTLNKQMTHRFDLTGKTGLITGSSGLLGYEHAAALLECNASVVLTDVCEVSLTETLGSLKDLFPKNKIETFIMDVTDMPSILRVFDATVSNNQKVDILINNATIDPKVVGSRSVTNTSRLETFSTEDWDYQLAVGLTGAFNCCKVFGTAMAAGGQGGVILNISSDLSVIAPDQRLYHDASVNDSLQQVKPVTYSVIKTGLIGLTRYIATYWAKQNVRCNALSPGGVLNMQNQTFLSRINELIPMGRMAHKSEYRATVQYLCSGASSYMNGQNIVVDGGRSVL